jgi:hypothetical protein
LYCCFKFNGIRNEYRVKCRRKWGYEKEGRQRSRYGTDVLLNLNWLFPYSRPIQNYFANLFYNCPSLLMLLVRMLHRTLCALHCYVAWQRFNAGSCHPAMRSFAVNNKKCLSILSKMSVLFCGQCECVFIIKAVPLHAIEALGGRGGIAPTHSRPRH